ncbi:MAG: hypothetical protein ACK4SY_08385 [Pyrobaculum sp.]
MFYSLGEFMVIIYHSFCYTFGGYGSYAPSPLVLKIGGSPVLLGSAATHDTTGGRKLPWGRQKSLRRE